MDREKRKGVEPVPDNAMELLNQLQIMILRQIEGYGWRLHFIRRPLFQEPVNVVLNVTTAYEESGQTTSAAAVPAIQATIAAIIATTDFFIILRHLQRDVPKRVQSQRLLSNPKQSAS